KDDPIEVCKMHLSSPIPRLADKLPGVDFGELEAVVARALAKRADDRFASAQEYVAAIDVAAPRRPSLTGQLPLAPSAPVQLASGDVIPAGDASYPPPLEVRSTDVLAEIPAEPQVLTGPPPGRARVATPAAGVARGRLATPAAGIARGHTATPAAGIARGPTATPAVGIAGGQRATPAAGTARGPTEPTEILEEPLPRPGTFLGLRVTPPPVPAVHDVPAAAPARAASPRWSRRRTIAVLGAAVVVGAVVVAIVAQRGGRAPGGDAGAAASASGASSQADPARDIVARANELVAQGDREAALDLLNKARKQYPTSASLPYAAGRIYFAKYYWTDGLKSFRDALRSDPGYRNDPELIKTVLRGFIMTPGYNEEIASFLREEIGSAAEPFLEETARDHPNPAIRSRAANELHRYH
ncbi:MAG TPA: hypothetical protein VFT22_02650, partial [Kofleriaceae bacterium]|nr:hypothetical protein [Kofleriaceae bacterium]